MVSGTVYRVGLALSTATSRPALHRLPNGLGLGPYGGGDVPNTVFPCGLIHDPPTDTVRLYYGAADTSICVATAPLGDLLEAVRAAPA
jgi:predicted GH43/DUF377 family glycosyl hydrolase